MYSCALCRMPSRGATNRSFKLRRASPARVKNHFTQRTAPRASGETKVALITLEATRRAAYMPVGVMGNTLTWNDSSVHLHSACVTKNLFFNLCIVRTGQSVSVSSSVGSGEYLLSFYANLLNMVLPFSLNSVHRRTVLPVLQLVVRFPYPNRG